MAGRATEAFNFTRDMLLRIDGRLDNLSALIGTANEAVATHRVVIDRLLKDMSAVTERVEANRADCLRGRRGFGVKEWIAVIAAFGAAVAGVLAAWASRGHP